MDDRELTEAAAKAAGITDLEWVDEIGWHARNDKEAFEGGAKWFRPLSDDGDALRLAVALGLDIQFHDDGVRVSYWANGVPISGFSEAYGDRLAATRRALVRTAAEIGKKVDAPLVREGW